MTEESKNKKHTQEKTIIRLKNEMESLKSRDFLLFQNLPLAYAYHQIIFDENKKPVDYIFVEVNKAFEELTCLKNIIGKKVTEVIPGIGDSEYNWIEKYADIALNGTTDSFDQYSQHLQKWYHVNVFSPEKEFFICLFSDISLTKLQNEELQKKNEEYYSLNEEYQAQNEEIKSQNEQFVIVNKQLQDQNNEKRKLLTSIEKSEKKYRTLVENINDVVWASDLKMNLTYISPSIQNLTGFAVDEYLKRPITNRYTADSLQKAKQLFGQYFNQVKNHLVETDTVFVDELEYTHKDGSTVWAEVKMIFITDESGNITGITGTSFNIDERKKLVLKLQKQEDALQAQNEEYAKLNEEYLAINEELSDVNQNLLKTNSELIKIQEELRLQFERMPIACIYFDSDFKIKSWNYSAEKLFGYHAKEAFGKTAHDIIVPERYQPQTGKIWSRLIEGDMSANNVNENITKDGRKVICEWTNTPLKDSLGNIIGVLSMAQDITEKRKIQDELTQSELKYKALYQNAPLSYQSLDPDGFILDVNPKWLLTLGYTKGEVISKWFGDFLHPDSMEHFKINFPKFKQTGSVSDIRFQMRRKDNTYIFVSFEGQILNNSDDSVNRTFCTFKDITEQIKAENALKVHEEKYKLLIENIDDVFWILDIESKKLDYVSPNYRKIFDLEEPEMLDDAYAFRNLMHPDDYMRLKESLKISLAYPVNNEYRLIKKDKTIVWVSSKSFNVEYDGQQKQIGVARDITIRRNMEERLMQQERLMSSSQAILQITSFELDFVNNKFTTADNFSSFFGITDVSAITPHSFYTQNIHPDDQEMVQRLYEENLKKSEDFETEYRYIHPISKKTMYIKQVSRYFRVKGVAEKLICSYQDVTSQKVLEQHLEQAKLKAEESDKLKSAFLANMSHEVRTPMNGIIGFSQLLRKKELSFEKRNEYFDIIEKNSRILLNVINDIIDISRIEVNEIQIVEAPFDLNELMNEIFAFYSSPKEKKINPKVNVSVFPVPIAKKYDIISDNLRLQQIINNLIGNALKFTEKGIVEFGYVIKEDDILFIVRDTGVGIPKDKLNDIFDRFKQADNSSTRKFGGTGLGLAISKGLVELLGGKIWVESEEGKGSVFYFTIPNKIHNAKTEIKEESGESNVYNWSDKLILIVEDEYTNYEYILGILEDTFVKILYAPTATKAIELAEQNKNIHLILMDIKLPDMSGLEATKIIHKFNPGIPVVAQTAYAMTEDKSKALNAGCVAYLSKPYDVDIFLRVIDRNLL